MNALFIGFGTIARALCSLNIRFDNLVIIDKEDLELFLEKYDTDNRQYDPQWCTYYKFVNLKLDPGNLHEIVEIIEQNKLGIVIDCSYNIDTLEILKILPRGVSYINTSIENWEHDTTNDSLNYRIKKINDWYHTNLPLNNILLDCGMNPGLISIWAHEIVEKQNLSKNNIKLCIVSEHDSQRSKINRKSGEFVLTWSPDGFVDEIYSPVEGTENGNYYLDKNKLAYDTISKSIRPNGTFFCGYTIRHSETLTMKKFFPNATMLYIYKCPDDAISSLFEFQTMKKINKKKIIYSQDIFDGRDELGVIIGDDNKLVWYGSMLSNDDVKLYPMSKYINATSYQVACGLYLGICVLNHAQNTGSNYRLMSAENIVEYPLYKEILENLNKNLRMKCVVFDDETAKSFLVKNKVEDFFIQ